MSNNSINTNLVFPDLLLLNDYGGNFENYFSAVYKCFENDFIRSEISFMGIVVTAQKHPEVDGLHRTFYHITHEGDTEDERTPDIRRMERVRYPKFCIENASIQSEFRVWKNSRGRDTRICIYSTTEKYLVVLTERPRYNLLWTAYCVDSAHREKKLMKEWSDYIASLNAKTA